MEALLILLALLVVAAMAGVVGIVFARSQQSRHQAEGLAQLSAVAAQQDEQRGAEQQAAISAAVQAALAERGAVSEALANERHETVQQVVQNVVQQASAALDARLAAGRQELTAQVDAGAKDLDVRTKSFNDQAKLLETGLLRVGDMVQSLQKEGSAQKRELMASIQASNQSTRELHSTTAQLREAFANPKARGQWGERMADDVLGVAGFVEGINYVKQAALANGGIPDVTFLLPRAMRLHMDAKFPLDNYARYLEAADERTQADAAKQFRTDVRSRVKDLAARNYTDGDDTVDCVLLFIPNESVYNFLHENDSSIIDYALGQQIVLCSPFTLFSVLAVVRQSVENFKLTQRSSEILTELGRFREEWGRFSGQLEKVDRHLTTLNNSFESLASTRVNKMVRTLDRIDKLQSGEHDDSLDELSAGVVVTQSQQRLTAIGSRDIPIPGRDPADAADDDIEDIADIAG